MALPTGTSTKWRLLDEIAEDFHYYVYDGDLSAVQGRDYLAEQLRQDGAASSLGAALSMSDDAELCYAWSVLDEDTELNSIDFDDPQNEDAVVVLIAKVPFDD